MDAANREENREYSAEFLAQQFKPGQSGNPKGRPKRKLVDEALIELLEAEDGKEAKVLAEKLVEKAKEGDTKALQLVAERTQGKPMQKVEHSGPEGGPIEGEFTIRFVKAE